MSQLEIIEQIKPPFRFLFDEFGYHVIACNLYANSTNWIVVLESPSCGRFLTLHDRGEIIVAMGPTQSAVWTDGPWFDLAVLVEYLSQGREMLENRRSDLERQLAWWAIALRPYMEQIRDLFVPEAFESAHDELDRIGERREEELRQQDAGNGHDPKVD